MLIAEFVFSLHSIHGASFKKGTNRIPQRIYVGEEKKTFR